MTTGIAINIILFFGMGVAALVKPSSVVAFVSFYPKTVDARNEVRAVYGGFGIAFAVLLLVTADMPDLRGGVLITVAVALLGMAGGRAVSFLLEKPGAWPIFYFFMESGLSALLLFSL